MKLAQILKSMNHDASTVFSEKISGVVDPELIKICKEEKYVLITLDDDFTNIHSYPPEEYEGIIVFRLKKQGAVSVIEAFNRLVKYYDITQVRKSLIIVESENIRIRH